MNISNVVLDRDSGMVTFDVGNLCGIVKPVHYSEERFAWESSATGKYCDAITEALVGVPRHAKYDVTLAESKPDKVKQPRYQDDSGEDWIDECARTFTREEFRGAMKFLIGKYGRRMGKKDSVKIEVEKMHDYSGRWLEYENKIDSE